MHQPLPLPYPLPYPNDKRLPLPLPGIPVIASNYSLMVDRVLYKS
jgi:hypothetical protein